MSNAMQPATPEDVRDCVREAIDSGTKLEIRGGGSKADIGAPREGVTTLDLLGLSGIVDYDPPELMLTVLPGTPLSQIQSLLENRGQMLAFEPFDHGPIYGQPAGAATIGGIVAAGVAGPQRLTSGSARDHLLGFKAVSGRGELFVGGAKVVKNVTGYDLPKVIAGSWGRLAVLTELTLKVLPRPPERLTLALSGLTADEGVAAMAAALGSSAEVAAAAHVPEAEGPGGPAMTLFRLQGVAPSVAARALQLEGLLASRAAVRRLPADFADYLWSGMMTTEALGSGPLWRISVPPSAGAVISRQVEQLGGRWLMDCAGGLVWAVLEGNADLIRAAVDEVGGHASLIRADAEMRAQVPALHPAHPGLAALEARVRRSFDPQGVFETGRF